MGHMTVGKIYNRLGEKIDGLTIRTPWNKALYDILTELYSPEEAEIVIRMPYGLSRFERVARITQYEQSQLRKVLDRLCAKGLVMDLWIHGDYYYMPSPMVLGIFEFTMMRTGGNLDSAKWARLFHKYISEEDSFWAANFKNGEKASIMRTLPYDESIRDSDYVEVLDYEKATALVEEADRFAIGICSCRHEKLHLGEKDCDAPLEACSCFGVAADYVIRHGLAKEVSKSGMLENIARSKELGLVLNADNVKKNITYLCHCCKCCCNMFSGINKYGYANAIVTSNFIAELDQSKCRACEKCIRACPVEAISLTSIINPVSKEEKIVGIDKARCLGCGVCAAKCPAGALKLVKRGQRVLHPETTFERVIIQSVERGTLQNQIFDDPRKITQKFMRGFIGGFLRLPPVKKALMSDALRSTFLASMRLGVKALGRGHLTEI